LRKATSVTPAQLREIFAKARIAQRLEDRELTEEVLLKEGEPDPEYGQDAGTKSQYIAYRNNDGKTIAEVHQFLRSDGKLGASGMPDPKMVFHDGVEYRVTL